MIGVVHSLVDFHTGYHEMRGVLEKELRARKARGEFAAREDVDEAAKLRAGDQRSAAPPQRAAVQQSRAGGETARQ